MAAIIGQHSDIWPGLQNKINFVNLTWLGGRAGPDSPADKQVALDRWIGDFGAAISRCEYGNTADSRVKVQKKPENKDFKKTHPQIIIGR